jgi:predicted transcriptional regulator
LGVVAYDAPTDRVQCHGCGAWYRRLSASHLRRHGLTVSAYKQRYGLSPDTPLESPHTSTLRRQRTVEGYERNQQPLADDTLHGEIGVLAYDALADRIQCHGCGRWFQKLTSFHLQKHGLSIPAYKERYGLNDSTPLETPRLTALRRRYAEEYAIARFLVPWPKGETPASVWAGRTHRPQYVKTHLTPEARQAKAESERIWTDAELLAELRALQATCGGYLTLRYVRQHRSSGSERLPSHETVVRRFGSWQRVCELLGQPYRIGRPKTAQPGAQRYWSDEAILARLRELKE